MGGLYLHLYEALTYNNGTIGFNGNITKLTCSLPYGLSQNYSFTYDGLNRMLSADYSEGYSMNQNLDRYTEKVTEYDKNGNIKKLQRYGQTGASSYGLVDNLTYTYNGNKITRVDDAVTATSYTGGTNFINGASTNNEYTYDANGNLTKDLNKNISNIQYNSLNLPQVVTFSDGSTITYIYTYDGKKLRTVHVIGSTTTTTDYCGNVIYENGTAKRLLTDEGYVDLTTNTYYYYMKDHQGNNRAVVNSSGTVQETNHYYPFGGLFSTSTNVQPYKYNGKELDTKKGLNWYDYGARHYDAALGRFTTVDLLTEGMSAFTPYGYCANNPIKFIDPDGLAWRPIYGLDKGGDVIYTGYEWVPESESYDEDGNLKPGLYSQAIFFSDNGTFNPLIKYNMGSSTAYVYMENGEIKTFDANTRPSSDNFAMIPEGIYHAKVGLHNGSKSSYLALRMSDIDDNNKIELGAKNPAYSDGRTYATGINIHKPGRNNLTGMTDDKLPISEGCLLIDRNRWNEFIEIFDTTNQRLNTISIIVSRSLAEPIYPF